MSGAIARRSHNTYGMGSGSSRSSRRVVSTYHKQKALTLLNTAISFTFQIIIVLQLCYNMYYACHSWSAGCSRAVYFRTGYWRQMHRLLSFVVPFLMSTETRAWCWHRSYSGGSQRGSDGGWWCTSLGSGGQTLECEAGYYCPGG